MTIKLRDYQQDAVVAVTQAWADGTNRPAVVLPTGSGKTVIFSAVASGVAAEGGRTLVLAHRDELIEQAVAKLRSVDPALQIGVVKADRNEIDASCVVASIQTLASEARRSALGNFTVGIVDEAHHATAPTYRAVMDALDIPWAGFTATMKRGDSAKLGDVWAEIVYQQDILSMIRKGYLVDPKGIHVKVPDLDLRDVRRSGGDYAEGQLGEALEASLAPELVAKAYVDQAAGRPALLFAPTVESARVFHEALVESGVRSSMVWGAMPLTDRRAALADFDAGRVDVLCNCMVLTEGYDSPRAEVCIIARPTQSEPLFIQMVGRVLRPFPGKIGALVIDVVGATGKHSLCSIATLAGREVAVAEGVGLLEAIDAEPDEDREDDDREAYHGPTEAREVDLFADSRQQWLQTRAGYWFIQAGERFIVLIPLPTGSFHVGWYSRNSWVKAKADRGGMLARDVADLGYAMAHGESAITVEEQMISAKDRAWRKRKANAKQLAYAVRLGAEAVEGERSGAVSDKISIGLASQRFDGTLTKWIEGQR